MPVFETIDAADGRTCCPAQGPAKVSCPSHYVLLLNFVLLHDGIYVFMNIDHTSSSASRVGRL